MSLLDGYTSKPAGTGTVGVVLVGVGVVVLAVVDVVVVVDRVVELVEDEVVVRLELELDRVELDSDDDDPVEMLRLDEVVVLAPATTLPLPEIVDAQPTKTSNAAASAATAFRMFHLSRRVLA